MRIRKPSSPRRNAITWFRVINRFASRLNAPFYGVETRRKNRDSRTISSHNDVLWASWVKGKQEGQGRSADGSMCTEFMYM